MVLSFFTPLKRNKTHTARFTTVVPGLTEQKFWMVTFQPNQCVPPILPHVLHVSTRVSLEHHPVFFFFFTSWAKHFLVWTW